MPSEVLPARIAMVRASFAAAATRALPRDVAEFTGRQDELDELTTAIDGIDVSGGVVGICAIGGMAGVGKTAFAVHAAHQLAPGFPDGQFFSRCTPTPSGSGRSTRRTRWPACC